IANTDYTTKRTIVTNSNLANPFTGYNFSHVHAYNTIYDNTILGGEYIIPGSMIFDEKMYDYSNMFNCNP
ncbi:MAG TPA: hypothetical protein P5243_10500, partial [Bacteroidales bacterium]|nr:hypothetical protein [Bacteroidales bacterium]